MFMGILKNYVPWIDTKSTRDYAYALMQIYFVTEVCVCVRGGVIFNKSRWQIYFETLSGLNQGADNN